MNGWKALLQYLQRHKIAFALGFLFFALLVTVLELYIWQATIVSVILFLGMCVFGGKKDRPLHLAFATNNAELKRLFEEARQDLETLRKVGRTAPDAEVRSHATHLFETGQKIFTYLKDHPEKIPSSRQFFTYYLDAAAEILAKYQKIQASGIGGQEAIQATDQAKRALNVLDKAFSKQFSRLLEGDLMDIENDIKVLEQTLTMEG